LQLPENLGSTLLVQATQTSSPASSYKA